MFAVAVLTWCVLAWVFMWWPVMQNYWTCPSVPSSSSGACIGKLRQIDAAVNEWPLENKKHAGNPVTLDQLNMNGESRSSVGWKILRHRGWHSAYLFIEHGFRHGTDSTRLFLFGNHLRQSTQTAMKPKVIPCLSFFLIGELSGWPPLLYFPKAQHREKRTA
jgi:hypothetical protein